MVASVLWRLGTGAVAQESGHVLVLIQLRSQMDVGQACASYRHWHWQQLCGCCRRLQVYIYFCPRHAFYQEQMYRLCSQCRPVSIKQGLATSKCIQDTCTYSTCSKVLWTYALLSDAAVNARNCLSIDIICCYLSIWSTWLQAEQSWAFWRLYLFPL